MMFCKSCNTEKPSYQFDWRSDRQEYRSTCKDCRKIQQRVRYHTYKVNSPFKHRAVKLKAKCKHESIKYDITSEYFMSIWTGKCPVFKKRIAFNKHRNFEFHAELDRINPDKGYTKGNVVWLSRKANRIKNNANPKELIALAEWLNNVST